MTIHRTIIASLSVLLLASCAGTDRAARDAPPAQPWAEREFRAAWVATVSNIDWPSRRGLPTDEQKREARAILDTAVALGLNAIIFQVRPHCDAMYESALEPWSAYLTGQQGRAPDPYYDPLQFWIDEAHDRGLELHAWFNPYRVLLPRQAPVSESSVVKTKPHIVRELPGGMLWLDPSHPETQKHSFDVVMDVVRRYDVDGIHFDDYFYPYSDGNFPDDDTWNAYVAGGGSMSRPDWRRSHVNTFIEGLYRAIKEEKKQVKFGLSPFGIWRPSYPPSIAGFDQYNGLYADARLWLNEGWVDYFTPQLYWPVTQVPQSFPVLMGWWTRENTKGRNLWPGMFTSRLDRSLGVNEVNSQIMIARGFVPEGPGHVHFSMKVFLRDSTEMNAGLKNGPYRWPALVPRSPWLDDTAPLPPALSSSLDSVSAVVSWTHPNDSDVFRWVVYNQTGGRWDYEVMNRYTSSVTLPRGRIVEDRQRRRNGPDSVITRTELLTRVAVSAVDRMGNESEKVFVDIPAPVSEAVTREVPTEQEGS